MSRRTSGAWSYAPAPSGRCLYHCKARTHPKPVSAGLDQPGWVYVCPAGTVSTAVFLGSDARPSPTAIQRYLQSRLARPERVKPRDLRAATRHGPELGPAAEEALQRGASAHVLPLLYWRRYPKKVGRRYSYLYACFRHGQGDVRFYPAGSAGGLCPWCPAPAQPPRSRQTARTARGRAGA